MTVDVAEIGIPAHITVLETLGRGGFGVVYRAYDTKLDRPVAVKVLTSIIDQSDLDRFAQECRLHGPLSNHRNVVTVYDAGYTPGSSPYLVMELIEGGTLTDRVKQSGPIAWDEAVEMIIPICGAVQAAHDRGVLHRDIKPSNILVSSEGPKLADFGIACSSDATSPHFAVSWLHAAPEAHDNKRDGRSDVYSLASTLYELVVGHAPFWAENQALGGLLIRLIEEPAPHLPPSVGPRWLDDVLQRALSKNPAERPQTAIEFGETLVNRQPPARSTAPAGFASPILNGFDPSTARSTVAAPVRLDSGPGYHSGQAGYHSGGSLGNQAGYHHDSSISGPAGYHSGGGTELMAERPRRRGGLLAGAVALVAVGVAGFALSPAGADIVDRLTAQTAGAENGAGADNGAGGEYPGEAGQANGSGDAANLVAGGGADASNGSTTDNTFGTSSSSSTSSSSTQTSETSNTTHETGSSTTDGGSSTTETKTTKLLVPHLAGDAEHEALAELADLGFTNATTAHEPSDTIAVGGVTRTDPAAGSKISADTHLTVYLSSGPEVVEVAVPNVIGQSKAAAEATLTNEGFTVKTTTQVVKEGSGQVGQVIAQTPSSGSAEAGSEVTITVGRKPLDLGTPTFTVGTLVTDPQLTVPLQTTTTGG